MGMAVVTLKKGEGRLLKDIIADVGPDGFLKVEDRVNAQVKAERTVISPGRCLRLAMDGCTRKIWRRCLRHGTDRRQVLQHHHMDLHFWKWNREYSIEQDERKDTRCQAI